MCQKKIFEYIFLSIVGVLLSIIVVSPVHATVIPAAAVLFIESDIRVKRAGECMPFQQKDPVFKDDAGTPSSADGRNDFIAYSADILAAKAGQGCMPSRVRNVAVDGRNMMRFGNIWMTEG